MAEALIAGVGCTPFTKPGTHAPYPVMAAAALRAALKDCGLSLADVQQAYAGYAYGAGTCGQRALAEIGRTGVPVINVRNACATGSTALFLARQAIASGAADCVLAFGFEEMQRGALVADDARTSPIDQALTRLEALGHLIDPAMVAPSVFGAAAAEYVETYRAAPRLFAEIAEKAHRHGALNPDALCREPVTADAVIASPVISPPHLTRLMACRPTCGAAAAVVVNEAFARRRGLDACIRIRGQGLLTDEADGLATAMDIAGRTLTARTAAKAYAEAGMGPEDVQVIELHDCFAPNEAIAIEALGFCQPGETARLLVDGTITFGGAHVVNPSGGLLAKGHPIGATGIAQCCELVIQLRGTAGRRQVPGARIAVQHNVGLGSACVVTVYER